MGGYRMNYNFTLTNFAGFGDYIGLLVSVRQSVFLGHISYKDSPNSFEMYMNLTHGMEVYPTGSNCAAGVLIPEGDFCIALKLQFSSTY